MASMVYKKGVLVLADVINYTTQANMLGVERTARFNRHFEKALRHFVNNHEGEFIKRIGDAAIIFFKGEENFLNFAINLREASRKRTLDYEDFVCDLRIVAHYGKFAFEAFDEKILDLVGPEGLKVFRIEKYASANDVIITDFLCSMVRDELVARNINIVGIGKSELKEFSGETSLYKLIFPEIEKRVASNLLSLKLAELEQDTKEIPIFGDLYPPMSMADNFINLDIKTGFKEDNEWKTGQAWLVDDMMAIDLKREKHLKREKNIRSKILDVKNLYENYRRGIILGLMGSGKTTILKYFAYREFKHNRELQEDEKQRFVLFIPCGNIMSYTQWYRQTFHKEKHSDIAFNIETILNYLTHCFLFRREQVDKKDERDIRRTEKLVHHAYRQGRLTILVDALDEAVDKDIKEKIIASIKTLFLDIEKGRQENNRVYLTSRYSERETYFCGKNAEVFQPVFEVRPLDMEQLRQMAAFFYGEDPPLYKVFDEVVWKEDIAAKIGGTPLTALLVIAFFEIFGTFDTRYHMYNIIVIFILVRVWKQIKEKLFNMDMRIFFKEARSKQVLKEQKSPKEIYDALTLLSYLHLDKGRIINEEDIIGTFEMYAKLAADNESAEEKAEQWLEQLKEDHLLVSAGAGDYVFIHSTVMEFLAARYIVEKLNNPHHLEEIYNEELEKDLSSKPIFFFQSDILPIAVGSGINTGARIFRFLEKQIRQTGDEERKILFYWQGLKCLAEFESFIDRQYRRKRLDFLRREIEKEITDNWDAVDWVYKYIAAIVLSTDRAKIKAMIENFRNISRLSMPYLLEKYLSFESFMEGDSELIALREDLLSSIINRELVDNWLIECRKRQGQIPAENESNLREIPGGQLLTMDSRGYHPDDKNFKYYKNYTGNELKGFLDSPNLKHDNTVTCAVISPNGQYIISGSYDHTIKLWDIDTGKEIRTLKGHNNTVNSICISPDGKHIVSGASDNTIKIWEHGTGKENWTIYGHSGWITTVNITPDGQYVISGSYDHTVKLWDIKTGKEIHTFTGHDSVVTSVSVTPDGKQIVSTSNDRTIRIWDIAAGRETGTLKGHNKPVNDACITPDGKFIISASADRILHIWDYQSGKLIRTIKGHTKPVTCVRVTPDAKSIISCSDDRCIKLWDLATGKAIRTFKGHHDSVTGVNVSPDGRYIVSSSYDNSIKIWDIKTGRELRQFKGHSDYVNSICFSPDGERVISGASDGTMKLRKTGSGQEIWSFVGHSNWITAVHVSPCLKYTISGSYDHTVKLWDMSTGKERRTFKGHLSPVNSVMFSPSGQHILSGSADQTVRLWDIYTGKEVRTFKGHKRGINTVHFSPDGNRILSGSDDNTIKLWDVLTGKELRTFKGHNGNINDLHFSADGSRFISCSDDGTIRIWDTASGLEIRLFRGHSDAVNSVCIDGSDRRIVSGSHDYTIRIWNIETGECLKTISLLWNPLEIKENPGQPGIFATANANGTVTLFDFRNIFDTGKSPFLSKNGIMRKSSKKEENGDKRL